MQIKIFTFQKEKILLGIFLTTYLRSKSMNFQNNLLENFIINR